MKVGTRVADRGLAVAGVLAVLVLAEVIGRTGLGGVGWPPISEVLHYVTEPSAQQLLGRALGATGAAAGIGFALGTIVALLVTALGALLPSTAAGLDRLAAVVHAVPLIAVGPLLITVAGRDATPTLVAALAAGFAVFIAATSALATTNSAQRDVFSVLGAGRLVALLRLQLPAGVPLIVDGLTLAAPAAVLGAVIGEWFGARRGIGVLLVSSMQNLQVEQLWAAALTAAAVSLLAYVLLVAWQLFAALSGLNRIVVPGPGSVFGDVVSNIVVYLPDLTWTLGMAAAGLLVGMALGTALAVAVWSSRVVSGMMTPVALIMRSVPVVAMIPVLARVFGYGWTTVLVITSVVSFFPAFVLVGARLRDAPPATSDLMAVLGASRLTLLRRLLLPHAVPGLLVAFRLTASTAVLGAMLAEYLMGGRGLGTLFAQSVSFYQVDRAWGTALVATVVSVACFVAARAVERWGVARFT